MKYIFLDTNIFIHFKAFNDVPWNTIIQDDKFTIVIVPIVITELDKHKTSSNNKVSTKAKNAIDKFRKIISGNSDFNFQVKLLDKRPTNETLNRHHLTPTHQDDSLLASIIEFPVQDGDEKILITSDFSLELRTKALNIKCIVMPEEFRLTPELDESEKKAKAIEKELNELKNRLPKPYLCFADGTNQLKYIYKKSQFEKDEYVNREMQKVMRNNSHMKKVDEDDPYKNLFALKTSLSRVSDSQIKEYNSELDKFYLDSEKYLNKLYDYESYLLTCVEIELFINNTGTSPAEDIDVLLHFPDGFELFEKLKKKPEEPNVPFKPKSLLDIGNISLLPQIMPYNSNPKSVDSSLPKLTQLKKTNSYDVEFKLKSLKHGGNNISLGRLYACFDSIENMKNFHIDYKLVIGNMPKSLEGKLHVVIEK